MSTYAGRDAASSTSIADHHSNKIMLRKDIQAIFDGRAMVIVPKEGQFVTHIISSSAQNYWHDYHNVLAGPLDIVPREYFFARFAWAILFNVKTFICQGRGRRVVETRQTSEGLVWQGSSIKDFLWREGLQLEAKYGGGGIKEAGPLPKSRKCKREEEEREGHASWIDNDQLQLRKSVLGRCVRRLNEEGEPRFTEADVNAVYFWDHDHGRV